MATFSDLRMRLREDILSEANVILFSEQDLLGFLSEASTEIASMGGFPLEGQTISVASGSSVASLFGVTDLSNIKFQSVTFENYELDFADFSTIQLYRGIGGQTRYYNYDPKREGQLLLAPNAHKAGNVYLEYVQDLTGTTYSGSDTPWGGKMADWHDAIVYAAGVKAFERSQEMEMAGYWQQRLEKRLQSLAIYLDNSNLLNLISRPQGGQA